MRFLITALVLWSTSVSVSLAAGGRFPLTVPSRNESYMALVIPIGKDAKRTNVPETQETEKVVEYDFRLEIHDWHKHQLIWSRDFTSQANAHDQSLTWGLWTDDPAYFVFLTINPDLHHPVGYHLYAFNLRKQCLYLLDPYIGHVAVPIFGITSPHTVDVSVLDRRRNSLDEAPLRPTHVDLERLLVGKSPL